MSFTGSGLLGSYGYGTTVSDALTKQYNEIFSRYNSIKKRENSAERSNSIEDRGDAEFKIRAAAVLHNYDYEWTQQKKHEFSVQRRKTETLPEDMKEKIHKWQQSQYEVFQKRQDTLDSLEQSKKVLIECVADLLGILAISIHLREILLYPILRDHIENGETLFVNALSFNKNIRQHLRQVRAQLSQDFNSTSWVPHLEDAWKIWEDSLRWEERNTIKPLVNWLQDKKTSDFKFAKKELSDKIFPNHDLNYGQQLEQMWEILKIRYRFTGNFQGIPRTRQEPDWDCPDGFSDMPEISFGTMEKFTVRIHDEPLPSRMHDVPANLLDAADIGQLRLDGKFPAVGKFSNRLDKPKDPPAEIVQQMEKLQQEEISESQEAIEKAHKATYGSKLVEKVVNAPSTVMNSVDKAKSYYQWLTSNKHTNDLEGSFNIQEVNLAFRNHGTHMEALKLDVTPIGNHYLLIHFDVQHIKEEDYRLKVHGCVEKPSEWTLRQLQQLCPEAVIRQPAVMECSGNGRTFMKPRFNHHVPWQLQAFGCYVWTGLPLRLFLEHIGVTEKAVDVVFTGFDSGVQENSLRFYQRAVGIEDPVIDHIMLVWENNGETLLKEHGYPLRILTPGWYGDNNVKWLQSIEVTDHKFKGRHMVSYSYTKQHWDKDLAVPSQEIRPRAMLLPPGVPSFMERNRYLAAGTYTWEGKAWVGGGTYRAVTAVEVSLDNGKTWKRAKLEPRIGIFAWHRFTVTLHLDVGLYQVRVRALGSMGDLQKVTLTAEDWNWHGMCDDASQLLNLVVVDRLTYTT